MKFAAKEQKCYSLNKSVLRCLINNCTINFFCVFALPGHLVFKLFLLLLNLGWSRSCTAWSCYAATVNKKQKFDVTARPVQKSRAQWFKKPGKLSLSLSLSSWTLHQHNCQLIQHFETINRHFRSKGSRCWIDSKDNLMKQLCVPVLNCLMCKFNYPWNFIIDKWNKALISTVCTLYLFLDKHLFRNVNCNYSICW